MGTLDSKATADRYRALSLSYQFGVPERSPRKPTRQRVRPAIAPSPHKVSEWLRKLAEVNADQANKPERTLKTVLSEVLPRHKLTLNFQYPAVRYIVDFYIPEVKLGIEVDGGYHLKRCKEDAARTRKLRRAGIRIIRFTNQEVHCDMTAVVRQILKACGPAYEQAPC